MTTLPHARTVVEWRLRTPLAQWGLVSRHDGLWQDNEWEEGDNNMVMMDLAREREKWRWIQEAQKLKNKNPKMYFEG